VVILQPPLLVDESHEGWTFGHISWGWPITNASHLDGVHFLMLTFQEERARYSTMDHLNVHFLSLR